MLVESTCPACNEKLSFDAEMQHFYPLRSGLTVAIENRTDWAVAGEVFINQTYAPALDRVKWPPGKARIVDLGSNVGFFTFWAADKLIQKGQDFRIDCVDASARNCKSFAARLKNQVKITGSVCEISLRNGAVGQRFGEVEFFEENTGFHAKDCTIPHEDGTSVGKVPYVDLDIVIPPGPIQLLKVDIESAEEDFCKTYSNSFLRRVQVCVMEVHEAFVTLDNILEEMKLADFTHCDKILQDGNVSVWVWWR
jgi:FkbM family methyltransferase